MENLRNSGDIDTTLSASPDLLTPSTELERLVVENARLRAEMLAAAERMERLQALIAGLGKVVTRDDAFAAVAGEGMRAFDATTATVTLLSEDGATMEIKHCVGLEPAVAA